MVELVAVGPAPAQRIRRTMPDGEIVRIGRKPREGLAIPWDGHISREHAELVFNKGELKVRQLENARNSIHYKGKPATEFTLSTGGQFRIGNTMFELVSENSTPQLLKSNKARSQRSLGKYAIIRKLGEGGMGAVYLANDTELIRPVAVKVLSKENAKDSNLVQRFKSEAQAAAALQHKNIVTTYEAGEIEGQMFIALEFIDGIDVDQLIKQRGRLSFKRSLDIIKQVTRALQHAYQQKIVHRDIKPSNLLITSDGTVKLTDMGLARSMESAETSGITRAGTTVGTVDYISPEQSRSSKAADTRSDIYSLGCTWYQMLTGEPPFPEGSLMNKLNAHATQSPPDPRGVNDKIPEATVAVLNRMMAKKPADRYQTPTELLDDLENDHVIDTAVTSMILAALEEDDEDEEEDMVTSQQTIVEHSTNTAETPNRSSVVSVSCTKCGKRYRIRESRMGKKLKCKKCGKVIRT